MRRIEQAMCLAVRQGKNWTQDNTAVRQIGKEAQVLLFDNLIAVFSDKANPKWTLAGWDTKTTRNRINALAQDFTWPYALAEVHGRPYLIRKNGERQELNPHAWYDALTGKPLKGE